jgi:hypothetical protein
MARSRLTDTTQDLIADGGAVLWSFVKGEQLEFPITLNFIEDASVKQSNNYVYEAVVVEANNVLLQTTTPTDVKSGGIQTNLFVRLPKLYGNWVSVGAFTKEEVVAYSGKYYKLTQGVARISAITPDVDPYWEETTLNKIYVQFPSTLGATWAQQATVDTPVYGFFELRVTEPTDAVFTRTFKPVRGMVQILFSPTASVTDVSGFQTIWS